MEAHFQRFRKRIRSGASLDLQDALFFIHTAGNILLRYAGKDNFQAESEDFVTINKIILRMSLLLESAHKLETAMRKNNHDVQ